MGKRPEVSLEKRAEINVLLSEGMSQKEIAAKLDISQSAVSKIIKRIIEHGTYAPKPRPGRPRVRRKKINLKNTSDFKIENTFNNEGLSFLSDPFLGLQEDNFFLSLCEIENTIKKENESSNECESQDSGYETGSYNAMKQEKPEISSAFVMEENIHFGVNNSHEKKSSSFVKLEGRKKIKSEFQKPANVMNIEGKHNLKRVEDQRIHHVKTEDRRPHNFIKTEVKPHHSRRSEEVVIPHRNIKQEKDYYYENDYHYDNEHDDNDDDNDRNDYFEYSNYQDDSENNAFYSNSNRQSDNEIPYGNVRSEYDNSNQIFYPSFSKNRHSQNKKKTTGYLRIYDKSIKRRPRKSDIQIKPTTFVKISERKRFHDKRSHFKSTSPLKIRFKKERF
ncbi:UNVERIFIED_CONTAM: hypothetical protein RMT77_007817 [Armadillidium vulgare]